MLIWYKDILKNYLVIHTIVTSHSFFLVEKKEKMEGSKWITYLRSYIFASILHTCACAIEKTNAYAWVLEKNMYVHLYLQKKYNREYVIYLEPFNFFL